MAKIFEVSFMTKLLKKMSLVIFGGIEKVLDFQDAALSNPNAHAPLKLGEVKFQLQLKLHFNLNFNYPLLLGISMPNPIPTEKKWERGTTKLGDGAFPSFFCVLQCIFSFCSVLQCISIILAQFFSLK